MTLAAIDRVHIDDKGDLLLPVLSLHLLNRTPEPTREDILIASLHQEPTMMSASWLSCQDRYRSKNDHLLLHGCLLPKVGTPAGGGLFDEGGVVPSDG